MNCPSCANEMAAHPVNPSLPLELARARREVEEAFASSGTAAAWWSDASTFGLVEVGLTAVARLLKKATS